MLLWWVQGKIQTKTAFKEPYENSFLLKDFLDDIEK